MAIIVWLVMRKQGLGTFFPLFPGSVELCEAWGWKGTARGNIFLPVPHRLASTAHNLPAPQAVM